jgi:type III restriction enzyme
VNRFINEKIQLRPGEDIRTLGYDRNLSVATERLVAGIQAGFTGPIEERLLPRIHTFRSALKSGDVSETTRRRVYKIVKSHVNAFAFRSDTEIRIADALDWSPLVKAWLPNVRGGFDFRIAYEYAAATYDYEPDFIVSLTVPEGEPAKYLLLEVKGGGGEVWDPERTRAKDAAALKWCSAVNNHGGFGHWEFLKAYSLEEVDSKLAQMAGCSVEKWPFMVVHPSKSDRWKGCVPKMPFAVAAGAFLNAGAAAETEESLFAADTVDWISWEGMPQVSKGWFVCRVNGTSMAPVIPDHAWCLFRPFSGDPEGKLLLVSHQDIHELGQPVGMTLKRFRSELIPGADGSSERVRVTLEPLNTNGHEPIVIDKSGESQVRVVAEFVKVLA